MLNIVEMMLLLKKFCNFAKITNSFMDKRLNRIKVVLAEQGRTNKWLAEQLGRDPATVSKWCTNSAQPPLDAFVAISKCLGVKMEKLIWDSETI